MTHMNKYIVFGLGFAHYIQLLNTQRQASNNSFERPTNKMKSWSYKDTTKEERMMGRHFGWVGVRTMRKL